MNHLQEITATLQQLTKHKHIKITTRGNTAIDAALSLLPLGKKLLIPEEGAWLHYHQGAEKNGIIIEEVHCKNAIIDLADLQKHLTTRYYDAFIYQNPGGYFAEQPMEEIYTLCKKKNCLVIIDVSGAIGTTLCDGKYADILVGSFGEWKLVEAKVGGFISCQQRKVFEKISCLELADETSLSKIRQKLSELPERIQFLLDKKNDVIAELQQILNDSQGSRILNKDAIAFVVIVTFKNEKEKQELVDYCASKNLPYTICPRSIRVNQPAISIEIKRLQQ